MAPQSKARKTFAIYEHLRRELYLPHPKGTSWNLKPGPPGYKSRHAPLDQQRKNTGSNEQQKL